MDLPGSRSTGPWPAHGPARQTQNVPLPWRPCPLCQARTPAHSTPGLWGPPARTEGAHSLPARPSGGPAASASASATVQTVWAPGSAAPLPLRHAPAPRPVGFIGASDQRPSCFSGLSRFQRREQGTFPGALETAGQPLGQVQPATPPFCVPAATTFSYPGVPCSTRARHCRASLFTERRARLSAGRPTTGGRGASALPLPPPRVQLRAPFTPRPGH